MAISKDKQLKFEGARHKMISEQLYVDLREDYDLPPAVCRSLVETFLNYTDVYYGGERKPGQVIYNAASTNVPAGRARADVETIPVKVTTYDSTDVDVLIEQGPEELSRRRIERIVNEAYYQGGTLTQTDVAVLLGISLRTVMRRMKDLQQDGTLLPTRGNLKDIGPSISHKTKILDLYLSGDDYVQIKRKTRHSSDSIMRYIKGFARFVVLYEEGFRDDTLRILSGHSKRIVNEYESLYRRFSKPKYQRRMDHIRSVGLKKNNNGSDPVETGNREGNP